MFIPAQLVPFSPSCNWVHPKHAVWFVTAGGKSATAVNYSVCPVCSGLRQKTPESDGNSLVLSPSTQARELTLPCCLEPSAHKSWWRNYRMSSKWWRTRRQVFTSPGSAKHNRKHHRGCFMILDPAQICICPVQGCVAHMFLLIKHNAHAWRKQETQIQFRTGLRFPLMRKFDDQL